MWRAAFLTVALYKLQTFQQKLDMFGGNVDQLETGYKDLMENAALADADDAKKQVIRLCPGVWFLCDNTLRCDLVWLGQDAYYGCNMRNMITKKSVTK